MVNYHEKMLTLLNSAVACPAYYEAWDETGPIPCVSYIEISNSTNQKGDTLKYSDIAYSVSVWAKSVKELQDIALAIDETLESNGFIRTAAVEQKNGDILRKIMTYTATGYENVAERSE